MGIEEESRRFEKTREVFKGEKGREPPEEKHDRPRLPEKGREER